MFTVIKSEGYQVHVLRTRPQHTPKRELGPCPHMGCVALVHQVYVNGKELYTFKHRIPLEKVFNVKISVEMLL